MTKKDYELIAHSIMAGKNCLGLAENENFREGYYSGILNAVEQLEIALSKDNPKFNAEKFREYIYQDYQIKESIYDNIKEPK